MNVAVFLPCWRSLILLFLFQQMAFGCMPQVCRRRRQVSEGPVKMKLLGCSGKSPIWVRQIAYCLNLPVTTMALGIKPWYEDKYEECAKKGCSSYISGNKGLNAVEDCVNCWENVIQADSIVKDFNLTSADVNKCVNDYIYAFLSDDLPVLTTENRFKSHIDLADIRPAEHWWSIKVELPCKPKTFVYWNAYCINSFAKDLKEGDYVLVQNKLIQTDRITFFVEFSDTCTFEPDEISIIWDESTPAPALPQTSSFPSQFPPNSEEDVSIFFDVNNAERLLHTDGKVPWEYQSARQAARKRSKRQVTRPALSRIGILFPCSVQNFQTKDRDTKLPYRLYGGGDRFLIDSDLLKANGNETAAMNFTLNYGYDNTGCFFDSGEVTVVPNPPANWLEKGRRGGKRIVCATCVNKQNDLDCLYEGKMLCAAGEVCQTEVRQINHELKLITKSCKQRLACLVGSLGRKNKQCRPGADGSVCSCCCDSDMCNAGNNPCSA